MPQSSRCTAANNEGPTDRERPTDPPSRPSGRSATRRRALAALGSVSLGLTAGCLGSVPGVGGNRVRVQPEDPGDDPSATPGEFYFLLDENGITVDELYHDTEDDALVLFYESSAETSRESDEEIGLIYRVFSEGIVDRGSTIEHLYTEVVNGFDGQVTGWGVESEWANAHLSGEISDRSLWTTVARTKVYDDDGDASGNETETGGDVPGLSSGDDPTDTDVEGNES